MLRLFNLLLCFIILQLQIRLLLNLIHLNSKIKYCSFLARIHLIFLFINLILNYFSSQIIQVKFVLFKRLIFHIFILKLTIIIIGLNLNFSIFQAVFQVNQQGQFINSNLQQFCSYH